MKKCDKCGRELKPRYSKSNKLYYFKGKFYCGNCYKEEQRKYEEEKLSFF